MRWRRRRSPTRWWTCSSSATSRRGNDTIAQWQRQLDDIKKRMDDSNRALAAFENAKGFSAIGDNENTFSERVIELSKQLMQAQSDRIQLQAYLDKLDSSPGAPAQPTSLPQISSDPVVQSLTTKLAETKAATGARRWRSTEPIIRMRRSCRTRSTSFRRSWTRSGRRFSVI